MDNPPTIDSSRVPQGPPQQTDDRHNNHPESIPHAQGTDLYNANQGWLGFHLNSGLFVPSSLDPRGQPVMSPIVDEIEWNGNGTEGHRLSVWGNVSGAAFLQGLRHNGPPFRTMPDILLDSKGFTRPDGLWVPYCNVPTPYFLPPAEGTLMGPPPYTFRPIGASAATPPRVLPPKAESNSPRPLRPPAEATRVDVSPPCAALCLPESATTDPYCLTPGTASTGPPLFRLPAESARVDLSPHYNLPSENVATYDACVLTTKTDPPRYILPPKAASSGPPPFRLPAEGASADPFPYILLTPLRDHLSDPSPGGSRACHKVANRSFDIISVSQLSEESFSENSSASESEHPTEEPFPSAIPTDAEGREQRAQHSCPPAWPRAMDGEQFGRPEGFAITGQPGVHHVDAGRAARSWSQLGYATPNGDSPFAACSGTLMVGDESDASVVNLVAADRALVDLQRPRYSQPSNASLSHTSFPSGVANGLPNSNNKRVNKLLKLKSFNVEPPPPPSMALNLDCHECFKFEADEQQITYVSAIESVIPSVNDSLEINPECSDLQDSTLHFNEATYGLPHTALPTNGAAQVLSTALPNNEGFNGLIRLSRAISASGLLDFYPGYDIPPPVPKRANVGSNAVKNMTNEISTSEAGLFDLNSRCGIPAPVPQKGNVELNSLKKQANDISASEGGLFDFDLRCDILPPVPKGVNIVCNSLKKLTNDFPTSEAGLFDFDLCCDIPPPIPLRFDSFGEKPKMVSDPPKMLHSLSDFKQAEEYFDHQRGSLSNKKDALLETTTKTSQKKGASKRVVW